MPCVETGVDQDRCSLREAAEQLGVHYMTAYRWVRQGLLPAQKVDGRLLVRRADVDAVAERRREDQRDRSRTRAEDADGRRRALRPHAELLVTHLVEGEAAEANALVRGLVDGGTQPGEVYTHVLTPALHSIGDLWEAGAINVAVEHRATAITSGIMSRLSEHFRRRGDARGIAVTLTAPGEAHGVATAMLADFLRAAGWDVHHLGTDVPLEDLRLFLDLVPADVVCVSMQAPIPPHLYEDLADACAGRELIMGGPGADLAVAEPLGITVLASPRQLVEHLDAHHDAA